MLSTRRLTAGGLVLLTLLTGVLNLADVHTPLRLYLTLAFVVFAPGWALAAYLRTNQQALIWSVAASLGIALGIILAQTMVSSGAWHPWTAMLILDGLTLIVLVHHLMRSAPPQREARR
ncbi:MAG: hypothetical protein ACRDQ1_19300 [Sciscionella sp.]